jgi:hypothetical protein
VRHYVTPYGEEDERSRYLNFFYSSDNNIKYAFHKRNLVIILCNRNLLCFFLANVPFTFMFTIRVALSFSC